MEKKNIKKIEKSICIALAIFIVVWFLPFINKGLDVQDTCSYLTKFKYIFDKDVWVNEVYYFLGELIGGIIYHIMPGYQLMALNVMSWLFYTATAFLTFYILRNYMSPILALLCGLVGSLFGITWVHCMNWNAISMTVQTLAIILLLDALKKDSVKKIVLAGFVFGINTYVRMPNILQLAQVVVVFWNYVIIQLADDYSISYKKCGKWKLPVIRSLQFALGGFLGGVIGAIIVISILGLDKFITDILNLLGVSGGSESSHGLVRIISLFYRGMLQGGRNWIEVIILVGIMVLIFFVGNRLSKRSQKDIRKYEIVACTAVIAIFGAFTGYKADYIDAHVLVAFGCIVFGAVAAIYYSVRDVEFSNLCATVAVAMAVLTIGTDTGSAYYRVYLGLPIGIVVLVIIRVAREKNNYIKMAMHMTASFVLSFVLAAGVHYATTFVYHDSDNEYLTTGVNNPIFAGIKTSPERAELIDRLEELLTPYSEYKLMTLGSFNIGYVITDMEPFFNSSWPDLEYLSMTEFEEYIENAKETNEYPVIVMGDMAQDMSGYWNMDKYYATLEFANCGAYEKLYEDKWYTVYIPIK